MITGIRSVPGPSQNLFAIVLIAVLFRAAFCPIQAAPVAAKRVLIINSLGSTAPPFTTHSVAFEAELTKQIGGKVDLRQVYLDHTHYGDAEVERTVVEYLAKQETPRKPDIVVPIGSPAGVFVEKHRAELFPGIPVVYAGMDRRRLSAGALRDNAAFVGESFDFRGMIEDILQVAPTTTNIVCVIGASPLERYWTQAIQAEFVPFTNKLTFTWLNEIPFDEVIESVRKLPPRSYVFFILLLQDASGITRNSDEALKSVIDASAAPVNSIFEHELGLGIVGGRLYRAELEGQRAAVIASHILRGAAATNFAPEIINPLGSQYNWRALHRWKISEKRLPAGAVIKYRTPTTWERHRITIILVLSALLIQAALITVLVLNLRRRIKAERLLSQSEERMKMAADAARLGLWEWDLTSNAVWVAGMPRDDIGPGEEHESDYSRHMRAVHPDDRDALAQSVAAALTRDGQFEHVYRFYLPNGDIRWVAARGKVEFGRDHKPVKMRGVGMDITARKLAEQKASESEKGFLLMANSAPVMIWQSGPDKLCTFFNEPWLAFTGRALDQELGNGWADGVHPEDLDHCLKVYTEAFDARQPFTMEYRLRRHDGEYRWIEDCGVPRYDAQARFLGYIGSCIDITVPRAAKEEAQRWQQELAHVDRFSRLGELAASLAHELNQPLTAIVSSAQAAERQLQNGYAVGDVLETLRDIGNEGLRASDIISGMRDMLKKDAGTRSAQNLNTLTVEVIEMLRGTLVEKQVRLMKRLNPDLPEVAGHAVQLRQVLLNLMMNACEAMTETPPNSRQLTIDSARRPDGTVEVSVSDTGTGFSEEILAHLFEPFQTTKSNGLGLGLSICRSIIVAHGGSLAAANNPGGGACLRVTLPSYSKNGP